MKERSNSLRRNWYRVGLPGSLNREVPVASYAASEVLYQMSRMLQNNEGKKVIGHLSNIMNNRAASKLSKNFFAP